MLEVSSDLRSCTGTDSRAKKNLCRILGILLEKIDGEYPWKHFIGHTASGAEREYGPYKTFSDYLEGRPPPRWSEYKIEDLRRLFADDAEIRDLLDVAEKRQHGGDRKSENIKNDNIQLDNTPSGTSKDATLRRLRKDSPELHAEVLAGELSANAAAIQAGFRHPMIQVRADDINAALDKLERHYNVRLGGVI